MGFFFGVVNVLVMLWFYSAAFSVKKNAVKWALIGGLAFLVLKFCGYSMIGMLQGSIDQSAIGDLTDQGYVPSERSTFDLSSEVADDQSTSVGVFFEFFPFLLAMFGVSFIRAKFILSMGYIKSLTHKTSLKMVQNKSKDGDDTSPDSVTGDLGSYINNLTSWWKNRKNSE